MEKSQTNAMQWGLDSGHVAVSHITARANIDQGEDQWGGEGMTNGDGRMH